MFYRLGAPSQPFLQFIFSEASAIKDEETGSVGAHGQGVTAPVGVNAQALARHIVAQLHQLLRI